MEYFKQADPLDILEANSAICWQVFLDGEGNRGESCMKWLLAVEKASGNRYYCGDGNRTIPNDMALMAGLTRLSVHYSIARFEQIGMPPLMGDFFRKLTQGGATPDRLINVKQAGKLDAALRTEMFDLELLSQLDLSVGAKKVA